jgi:hypothetical protein
VVNVDDVAQPSGTRIEPGAKALETVLEQRAEFVAERL